MNEVREASPALLLARYRSEAVIGEGAFGRVTRAFDTRLKRPVAIKTLKRSLAQTDLDHFRQLEDRFIREAEAGARVGSHANLVTVYDLIEDEDRSLHLILLYVSGGTIGERLTSHGPFPLTDALRLTMDIARGLHAAHEAGIVHRDIKPANIFIAMDGRAQVGDFGIAQLDHLSARTYAFVGHPGTPLYMSPEQSQQTGYVRPDSDQYSVGLVLFEMLHGQAYKRLREREVADFLATLPSPVAALIERMTAIEPDQRYRTMADVMLAIRRIEQSLGFDTIAPISPARQAPAPPIVDAQDNASGPPTGTAIPIRPIHVSSQPTPDYSPERSRPDRDPAAAQLTVLPRVTTPRIEGDTLTTVPANPTIISPPSDHKAGAAILSPVIPVVDLQASPFAGSNPLARTNDVYASVVTVPAPRRPRTMLIALIGGLLTVLIIGGIIGVSRLNNGRAGGLATATVSISAVGAVALSDTASGIATPTVVSPTAASAIVTSLLATATVAPTPQPTVAPSVVPAPTIPPTFAPTALSPPVPSPTSVPAPSLGVFGVGTTDRSDLEALSPADAVDTFVVGQEVFAFVNYDSARPGVDTFDITLIATGNAQPPLHVTVQKPGGFVFASLGKPTVGSYQIEVRHDGTLVPNQPTFQVQAPAPTPVPAVAPRTAPATGGQSPATKSQPAQQPVQQPASQPKSPTCVPGTC